MKVVLICSSGKKSMGGRFSYPACVGELTNGQTVFVGERAEGISDLGRDKGRRSHCCRNRILFQSRFRDQIDVTYFMGDNFPLFDLSPDRRSTDARKHGKICNSNKPAQSRVCIEIMGRVSAMRRAESLMFTKYLHSFAAFLTGLYEFRYSYSRYFSRLVMRSSFTTGLTSLRFYRDAWNMRRLLGGGENVASREAATFKAAFSDRCFILTFGAKRMDAL